MKILNHQRINKMTTKKTSPTSHQNPRAALQHATPIKWAYAFILGS